MRNKELHVEIDILRKQIMDSEVTQKVLAEEAENSKKDVITATHETSLVAEQATLQQHVSEGLRDELSSCRSEKEGYESRIQQLHNQIELLTEKGAVTISQLTIHNEELESQINKLMSSHQAEIELITEEHGIVLKKLINDNAEALSKVEVKWTETVSRLQEDTAAQIGQHKETVANLKNESKITSKKHVWEIDAIRKDFSEALNSQRETAAENSQRDGDLIAGLKAELVDCEAKLVDAHTQFEQKLSETEEKNLSKSKECQNTATKLSQAESHLQQYAQETVQHNSTVSLLEAEISSLKGQVADQTASKREFESQLRLAGERESLLRSEKQADVIKMNCLEEQLALTTSESDTLATQLNQSQRRSEHSRQATETLERHAKRHLSESERLKAALDLKDQHLEASRAKVVELQVELQHYRARADTILDA